MNTCNIAELMLNDDVNKLLALCTPEQKAPPVGASDYDRFLQLCRCLPLFYGHAVLPSAQEYLKRYFDSDLPIIPQNAAKLWHLTAERLLCMGEAIPPFSINEQTKPVLLPPLSDGKIYTELAVKED